MKKVIIGNRTVLKDQTKYKNYKFLDGKIRNYKNIHFSKLIHKFNVILNKASTRIL